MANKFWRNLGGGIVNAVLPGTPYNRYTGEYGRAPLRAGIISGVIGQAAGPLGGQIAQMIQNRDPNMQAWNAGLEGWAGIHDDLSHRPELPQAQLDIRDIGRPQGRVNSFQPMFGNFGGMSSLGNNLDNFMQPESQPGLAGGFTGDGNFNFGPGQQAQGTGQSNWRSGPNSSQSIRGVTNRDYFGHHDSVAGFGIGIGGANSPSQYAIGDAAKANARNKGIM